MVEIANVWEYLDNSWVLAGLVLIVLAGILRLLPVKNLDSPAIERLMHKGITYLFIFGLVSTVLGFIVPELKDKSQITQTISNNSGTSINAGGNVNATQSAPFIPDRSSHQEHPNTINQEIKDNSGIAINTGGDVLTEIQRK